MKASLKWLKEFVDIELSPRELAHKLTHAGLEVESIQELGRIPDSVLVVQIEKIEKHPQADRLSLCDVNMGSEVKTIVCGAKNMKVGDKVSLAQPGTLLPDGKKIERSKIRGIQSEGMLCSEVELGLFEESNGLLILPKDFQVGKSLSSQLNVEDVIFEINVTPNRADCLSIYGIAREISAITGKPLKDLQVKLPPGTFSLEGKVKIEVKNPELCPSYTARMIQKVQIAPSPFEVRLRLERMGVRSINNVVDATNYVMLELGQPLHAFDAHLIHEGKIIVRLAHAAEKVTTLDKEERELSSSDLLITDPKQSLAIAGVMGCASSGVSESTKDLILESAYFEPKSVRKTSKRLGLQSESSYRFERGVDPNALLMASDRLAYFILQWAGGELSKECLNTAKKEFPKSHLQVRLSRIHQILGVQFSAEKVEEVLKNLHLNPRVSAEQVWDCAIPTYRQDLQREIDLIEEVARLMGYDQITARLPESSLHVSQDFYESFLEEKIRPFLRIEGFYELINYSFGSAKEFKKCGLNPESFIELSNPLSEDLAVMRPSLIPSMLASLRYNISRQSEDLRLFELRSIYSKNKEGKIQEKKSLVLAMSGKRNGRNWALPVENVDFYDLKGIVEKIFKNYKLPSFKLKLSSSHYFHPGASASIWVEDQKVGDFGLLHPQFVEDFDLRVPVVLGEIDLEALLSLKKKRPQFEEISKFPWVDRDLTVVVSESLESDQIEKAIFDLQLPCLKKMNFVDVYRGDPIEKGKKALTYSLIYLDPEKTLTDLEVNENHQKVMDHLKQVLPIQWR